MVGLIHLPGVRACCRRVPVRWVAQLLCGAITVNALHLMPAMQIPNPHVCIREPREVGEIVSTKLDESTDILASLTEDPACEGYAHHDGTDGHVPDAPAEWIVRFRCGTCGQGLVLLLCDGRYQNWIQDMARNSKVTHHCGHKGLIRDALISAVRL